MPTSRWYGEQHEWSPNELNFMVKAVYECQQQQQQGKCSRCAEDCCNCNYAPAVQAVEQLDAFTKSRVFDKANTLDIIAQAQNAYIENAEKRSKKYNIGFMMMLFVVLLCIVMVKCSLSSTSATKPMDPFVSASYDYKKCISITMKHLQKYGPVDVLPDNGIDCKDWSLTFMYIWYNIYNFEDGTCVLVRNDNAYSDFDHLFIGIWTGTKWICIEPQACFKNDWSLESYWGNEYNEMYNQWHLTRAYLVMAYWDSKPSIRYKWNFYDILRKTKVENTYGYFSDDESGY